jgi:chromatin segregation and condensation protein Rec8/ScpA/Scc1 (kleisin family)
MSSASIQASQRFYKSMFSRLPVKQLDRIYRKPITAADVAPQFVKNENTGKSHWRKPRLSLRVQSDLRKAAESMGEDSVALGLPEKSAKKVLRARPNKLEKHERKRAEREASIRQNMEKMNDTIKNWREVNKGEELHGDYPMMSTIYLLSLSIFF